MTIFCIIYYILSFLQSAPCIYKLIKTRSSRDYSLLNRLCQYVALIFFTLYIFTNKTSTISVKIIGVVDVLLLTTENILIILFRKGNNNERPLEIPRGDYGYDKKIKWYSEEEVKKLMQEASNRTITILNNNQFIENNQIEIQQYSDPVFRDTEKIRIQRGNEYTLEEIDLKEILLEKEPNDA